MERTFTMSRAQVVAADPSTLKAAIVSAAGSETGAESIMRSLERLGSDDSIEFFEMSEVRGSRRFGGAAPAAWRVRADRGYRDDTGA
jgi:hypothetical protein